MDSLFEAHSIVWPLVFLLIALYVIHQLRETLNPIMTGMVTGLSKQAQTNAGGWAIAILFGLSASFSAFWEVFHGINRDEFDAMSIHQYIANWCKVLNPFVVATLARITMKYEARAAANATNPPFPTNGPTPTP